MKEAKKLFGNEIIVSKFDYSRIKGCAGIFQELQILQRIVNIAVEAAHQWDVLDMDVYLYSFIISALCGSDWSAILSRLISHKRAPISQKTEEWVSSKVDPKLQNLLFLTGIQPQFLSYSVSIMFTVPTGLSHLDGIFSIRRNKINKFVVLQMYVITLY
jgi:hypothetical protein